jgi:hypothetical protein
MAKELLSNCEKHPSADIFSLGVLTFEIATLMLELPSEGEGWHDLRDGRIPCMDSPRRSEKLQDLVGKVGALLYLSLRVLCCIYLCVSC